MGDPLHHATVAHEGVGVVIDDRVPGPVEGGGKRPFRKRHADRVAEALAQRPRRGFYAEIQFTFRVTRGM